MSINQGWFIFPYHIFWTKFASNSLDRVEILATNLSCSTTWAQMCVWQVIYLNLPVLLERNLQRSSSSYGVCC